MTQKPIKTLDSMILEWYISWPWYKRLFKKLDLKKIRDPINILKKRRYGDMGGPYGEYIEMNGIQFDLYVYIAQKYGWGAAFKTFYVIDNNHE